MRSLSKHMVQKSQLLYSVHNNMQEWQVYPDYSKIMKMIIEKT
jgi:hypothetical protein